MGAHGQPILPAPRLEARVCLALNANLARTQPTGPGVRGGARQAAEDSPWLGPRWSQPRPPRAQLPKSSKGAHRSGCRACQCSPKQRSWEGHGLGPLTSALPAQPESCEHLIMPSEGTQCPLLLSGTSLAPWRPAEGGAAGNQKAWAPVRPVTSGKGLPPLSLRFLLC